MDYIACADGLNKTLGGAEMTFHCLLEQFRGSTEKECLTIDSENVDESLIEDHKDKVWIIGNFYHMISNNVLSFFEKHNVKYYVVEFDYKFLECRNLEIYTYHTKKEFVYNAWSGRVDKFLAGAEKVMFMSDKQMYKHWEYLKLLQPEKCVRLSSCFSDSFFEEIYFCRDEEKIHECAIYGQHTLQKGSGDAIFYCEENGLKYIDVYGIWNRYEFLRTLASCKNLVFLPKGGDTCPRLAIEAKLLGLNVICNDNVEHINENWWQGTPRDIENYLRNVPNKFIDIVYEG